MNTLNPAQATWQDHILQIDDTKAMVRLDMSRPLSTSTASVSLDPTPPEFGELYASLERQVAGIGDITLIAGEALEAERPYVLGITSAVQGEGKTTVALHLALTVARDTFKRVCLMDLSLGGESVTDRLSIPANGAGLIPAIEETDNRIPTLQIAGIDNLAIIPAGRAPVHAQKLVRSPRLAQMIASARQAFDVVIVDMPSTTTGNALPLARNMDGVIMVARAGATPSDLVAVAIDNIGRDRVVGLVMNRMPTNSRWGFQRNRS